MPGDNPMILWKLAARSETCKKSFRKPAEAPAARAESGGREEYDIV